MVEGWPPARIRPQDAGGSYLIARRKFVIFAPRRRVGRCGHVYITEQRHRRIGQYPRRRFPLAPRFAIVAEADFDPAGGLQGHPGLAVPGGGDVAAESGRRSGAWVKFKITKSQEFVIGGYTLPEGSRKYFGSLIVGYALV